MQAVRGHLFLKGRNYPFLNSGAQKQYTCAREGAHIRWDSTVGLHSPACLLPAASAWRAQEFGVHDVTPGLLRNRLTALVCLMHWFEHEFGEILKRKSTVKGDRIA